MTALTKPFRRRLKRGDSAAPAPADTAEGATAAASAPPERAPVEIGPGDPLLAYFQSSTEAVDIDALELDSPACAG